MTATEISVLARRGDWWAFDKPAELPTEPTRGFDGSLLQLAARALGRRTEELHAASRLDVGVSGVVLVVTGSAARRELEALRRQGGFRRHYLAIGAASPEPPAGRWSASIGRHGARRFGIGGPDARPAHTRYATLATGGGVRWGTPQGGAFAEPALMLLTPETGRTHQLRLHAAAAGAPLLGDRRYGGPSRCVTVTGTVVPFDRIALHAATIVAEVRPEPWHVEAPVPPALQAWWHHCGGSAAAWALDVGPGA